MTDDDRRRAAQAILEFPLFHQIWDELEDAAINAAVYAKYDDHEARQAHTAEVRAIRRVRERLVALSKEGDTPGARRVPA